MVAASCCAAGTAAEGALKGGHEHEGRGKGRGCVGVHEGVDMGGGGKMKRASCCMQGLKGLKEDTGMGSLAAAHCGGTCLKCGHAGCPEPLALEKAMLLMHAWGPGLYVDVDCLLQVAILLRHPGSTRTAQRRRSHEEQGKDDGGQALNATL